MTKPILAATLAVLLAAAPAVAECPSAVQPVLTALVKAQIALEDRDLNAVEAAVNDAYLAVRISAAKGVRTRSLDAVGEARKVATYVLDLLVTAVAPTGACRVRGGFDGGQCSTKANNALAKLNTPNSGSVWVTSLDSQEKVTEALTKAFGATLEPYLNTAIIVAKEEGS